MDADDTVDSPADIQHSAHEPEPAAPLAPARVNDEPDFESLSPAYVEVERRVGYIVAVVLIMIASITGIATAWFGRSSTWVLVLIVVGWFVIVAVLGWFAHFWPPIAYRNICWRLTKVGMEIRQGVLWKHRISIPIARVQHVDVSQGPIQRMYALGKLTIHTAGTRHASVELDGLDYDTALQVRDQLIAHKESLDAT